MREESNYWVRRARSLQLSRRRFVGGAATAGMGAAALGLVGCGDDDDDDSSPTSAPSGNTPQATSGASPAASPTQGTTAQRGGIARFTSANNTWDTFDADRSRFTPFAVVLGYTNHGVVQWDSFKDAKIGGGFAERWEQPDSTTYVFKVRNGLVWHNKAPVNGRAANAQDIVAFMKRNKEGKTKDGKDDPNFYRKAQFSVIDTVEATDNTTVRVKLSKPTPLFLNTLAQPFTKVQAPEAVAQFEADYQKFSADQVIGTGSYTLSEFKAEGSLKFRRFDKADAAKLPANLDGIDYLPLFTDPSAQQAAFEQRQLDAFTPVQKAVLDDVKKRFEGKVYEQAVFSANPMAGTYYGGAAPWNNPNLVGAFFRTIDRRALIQQMFQGRGVMAGNVPPTQSAFTITERELIQLPGYLENRATDLAEAKKMWEAAGGPALGTITVDIPDIWEGLYSGVSSLITNQLKQNLGNDFQAKIETYATITTKIVKQEYGSGRNNIWYGWISELTDVEPTDDVVQRYNSKQEIWKQFGVKVDEVDAITDKLQVELDVKKRAELLKQAVPIIIRNWGMGIPYNMVNINNTLYWNYLKVGEAVPFVTAHNLGRDVYFDQKDATWQGRPS